MDFYLTQFDRTNIPRSPADFCEKAGHFGLGLLQIGFGRNVEVTPLNNGFSYNETTYSTIEKVTAVVAFILLCPLTVPLAILGSIGLMCSTSHQDMMDTCSAYQANLEKILKEIEELTPEEFLEQILKNIPGPAKDKTPIDPDGINSLDECKAELMETIGEQKNTLNTDKLVIAKIKFLQQLDIQKYKNEILELIKNDELTPKSFLSELCVKMPGYVTNEDFSETEETQTLDEFKAQLLGIINEDQNKVNTEELVRVKTKYLQRWDIQKFESHKGSGIPNPDPKIPLLARHEFDHRFQSLKLANVHLEERISILEMPEYLYRYDHPSDSTEGGPMALLGIRPRPNSNWKITLDYVQTDVLPQPIKKMQVDELYALIVNLHSKITGSEEKIRDEFVLISDPNNKCENSFSSIQDYLGSQEDGTKLVRKIARFQQKFQRWGSFEKAAPYITPKEWNAFQKAVFCPPSPDDLEQKTKAFLEEALLLMEEGNYHPYQVAAFLHYGLTTLHLFGDGNGRLSRLFTNIYLMQEGYKPFYVVSDAKYTALYQKENYDFEFAKFLLWSDEQIEKRKHQKPSQQSGCAVQ